MSKLYKFSCMRKVTVLKEDFDFTKSPAMSLEGEVYASINALTAIFGQPEVVEDGKTNLCWMLRFGSGNNVVYAAVYDYKEDCASCNKAQATTWHVGGQVTSYTREQFYTATTLVQTLLDKWEKEQRKLKRAAMRVGV